MDKTGLRLNDKHFSAEELKSGDFPSGLTPFEASTLSFCHSWLSGRETFTTQTSGSTGLPKSITFSRSQIEFSARNTAKALHLNAGDTALLCLDTQYIAGKMMLVRSFVTGMNIIAIEPGANPFESIAIEIKIDFAAIVPYQLHAILNSKERRKLDRVTSLIIGGGEVDAKTRTELAEMKVQAYATYGMTETISHIALQKLNPPGQQDYFQVLPGITIHQDNRGCLVITARDLRDEVIVTNDLVEIIAGDKFRWLGRLDNLINTGGVKVIPEKVEGIIEKIFSEMGMAHRFFVAGLPDDLLGSQVVLFLEGNPAAEQQTEILRVLSSKLARYEVPKQIKTVERFVETATLKVNRAATVKLAER